MNKLGYFLFGISFIINLILVHKLFNREVINPNTEKIDSLELELKNKKDSIVTLVDTVFIKIHTNNKEYEDIRNTIVNNTVNDDYIFFTKYLNSRDSINNN